MSEIKKGAKARLEILEVELDTVRMLRRRAKEDPYKAGAAAQREIELQKEIDSFQAA